LRQSSWLICLFRSGGKIFVSLGKVQPVALSFASATLFARAFVALALNMR
jgi:hypothetical protein